MQILAIDPGNTHSAWVSYCQTALRPIVGFGFVTNEKLLSMLYGTSYDNHRLVIEMIASYGMPVGREVFETCVWIGRFREAFGSANLVYRKDIKHLLCGSLKAKDANVRQALLDRFPATGGGKVPQIGTKAEPGPLYGVSKHVWSALAVAVHYVEDQRLRAAIRERELISNRAIVAQ